MNYLSVENLTKSFGERILFKDLSFGIDQGQKASIVAKNGSGKSTLLRALLGKESIDSGNIIFRKGILIAFMEQEDKFNSNHSVYDVIYSQKIPQIQAIKEYSKAILENNDKEISRTFELMNETQAWEWEVEIQKVLSVLKLDKILEKKINQLSGGQKKRISLASVLISKADFLILDEPTNHLDLDMIEWLESFLSNSKSTILMVTHDRYFLEVVCNTIFELADLTLYKYKGNFSYYLEKKAEREEQLNATITKAKNLMRTELEWMQRQPKARGTKQKARIDSFKELKKVAKQKIQKDEMLFDINMERLGSKIVELHNVGKTINELIILESLSYNFKRGERLGIVGKNGSGKSTLLNMIVGIQQVSKGKIIVGETVKFGYYHQDGIKIKNEQRVIDVIRDIAEFIPLNGGKKISASQFLERFLFPRDMHYNYVEKLSGGEKRRLYLMTVLMANPNFLILDEPTNDLDIFTMSVLEQYLLEFKGCVIVVSHDRYFMDKMVDHIFVFEGEGHIKDITGNYMAYRKYQKELNSNKKVERKKEQQKKNPTENKSIQKKKLSYKEKQEYEKLETEISQLEHKKDELSKKMINQNMPPEEINKISDEFAEIISKIDKKTDRWLELSEFI